MQQGLTLGSACLQLFAIVARCRCRHLAGWWLEPVRDCLSGPSLGRCCNSNARFRASSEQLPLSAAEADESVCAFSPLEFVCVWVCASMCVCVQPWHLASCTATWQSAGCGWGGLWRVRCKREEGKGGEQQCRAARCTLCAAFSLCEDGSSGCVRTREHSCLLDGVVGQGWRMHAGGWCNACIDWVMRWLGRRPLCWAG